MAAGKIDADADENYGEEMEEVSASELPPISRASSGDSTVIKAVLDNDVNDSSMNNIDTGKTSKNIFGISTAKAAVTEGGNIRGMGFSDEINAKYFGFPTKEEYEVAGQKLQAFMNGELDLTLAEREKFTKICSTYNNADMSNYNYPYLVSDDPQLHKLRQVPLPVAEEWFDSVRNDEESSEMLDTVLEREGVTVEEFLAGSPTKYEIEMNNSEEGGMPSTMSFQSEDFVFPKGSDGERNGSPDQNGEVNTESETGRSKWSESGSSGEGSPWPTQDNPLMDALGYGGISHLKPEGVLTTLKLVSQEEIESWRNNGGTDEELYVNVLRNNSQFSDWAKEHNLTEEDLIKGVGFNTGKYVFNEDGMLVNANVHDAHGTINPLATVLGVYTPQPGEVLTKLNLVSPEEVKAWTDSGGTEKELFVKTLRENPVLSQWAEDNGIDNENLLRGVGISPDEYEFNEDGRSKWSESGSSGEGSPWPTQDNPLMDALGYGGISHLKPEGVLTTLKLVSQEEIESWRNNGGTDEELYVNVLRNNSQFSDWAKEHNLTEEDLIKGVGFNTGKYVFNEDGMLVNANVHDAHGTINPLATVLGVYTPQPGEVLTKLNLVSPEEVKAWTDSGGTEKELFVKTLRENPVLSQWAEDNGIDNENLLRGVGISPDEYEFNEDGMLVSENEPTENMPVHWATYNKTLMRLLEYSPERRAEWVNNPANKEILDHFKALGGTTEDLINGDFEPPMSKLKESPIKESSILNENAIPSSGDGDSSGAGETTEEILDGEAGDNNEESELDGGGVDSNLMDLTPWYKSAEFTGEEGEKGTMDPKMLTRTWEGKDTEPGSETKTPAEIYAEKAKQDSIFDFHKGATYKSDWKKGATYKSDWKEDGRGTAQTAQEDVATGGTASLQNQGAQDENLKPTIKPTMGNTQGQVGGTPPGMEDIERPDLMQAIWDERAQEAQDWVGIGNGAELIPTPEPISTPEPKTEPDIPESLRTGRQGAQYDPAQGENNTAQSNQSLLGQNNP
jgi:hypothetical protein